MALDYNRRKLDLLRVITSEPPPRVKLEAMRVLRTIYDNEQRAERSDWMARLRFEPETDAPDQTNVHAPPHDPTFESILADKRPEEIKQAVAHLPAPADVRPEPTEQAAISTAAVGGIEETMQAKEQEFLKTKPQLLAGRTARTFPEKTLDRAEAFAAGVLSGIVGGVEPDQFGSPVARAAAKYRDSFAFHGGEFSGAIVPIGIAGAPSRMAVSALKTQFPQMSTRLLRLIQGGGTGGTLATGRQIAQLASGQRTDFELKELGEEALLFMAADLLLMPAGAVAKDIKASLLGDALKKDGTLIAEKAHAYTRSILDRSGQRIAIGDDFKSYQNFKDVAPGLGGGLTPTIPMMQEIDGALSVAAKRQIPNQMGPIERNVLRRNEDYIMMSMEFAEAERAQLQSILGDLSKKDRKTLGEVLGLITGPDAKVETTELLKREIKRKTGLPDISEITKDAKIVGKAQEFRLWLERMRHLSNNSRRLLGQSDIGYIDRYTPNQLKRIGLFAEAAGFDKEAKDIARSLSPPDFIKPDKPFVAHSLARKAHLPDYMKESDMAIVAERYLNGVIKDIYHTPIIKNNQAFSRALRDKGFEESARSIEEYTAEVFAGVKPRVDKALFGLSGPEGRLFERSLRKFRHGLVLSVFPGNLAWNLVVQPSSAAMTVMRYGGRDSVRGAWLWFGNDKLRKEITDRAYSLIVKASKPGRVTRQDINRGVSRTLALERKPLETAVDAMNFFTEQIERNLTGWSVASALSNGQRRGLRGRALWGYASDGGAKTQSMYNRENLPGILRNEVVKTMAPFQTFSLEVYNAMREFAGRTGTRPDDAVERTKWILRFLGAATAFNMMGQQTTGRQPWEIRSFIPFFNFMEGIGESLGGQSRVTSRVLPAPLQAAYEIFGTGVGDVIRDGNWRRLRKASIRYLPGMVGIPGGVQANRLIDGWIALSENGMRDGAGRFMFPIYDTKDEIRSMFSGPWSTVEGRQYWRKRGGLGYEPEEISEKIAEAIPGVSDVQSIVAKLK